MSFDIYTKWKFDYSIFILHIQFFLDSLELHVDQENIHPTLTILKVVLALKSFYWAKVWISLWNTPRKIFFVIYFLEEPWKNETFEIFPLHNINNWQLKNIYALVEAESLFCYLFPRFFVKKMSFLLHKMSCLLQHFILMNANFYLNKNNFDRTIF